MKKNFKNLGGKLQSPIREDIFSSELDTAPEASRKAYSGCRQSWFQDQVSIASELPRLGQE